MRFIVSDSNKVRAIVNIFRNLTGLVEDINLYFRAGGLYAQGMDSSHICLCELNIEADWFDNYTCDMDGVAGLHSKFMYRLLDCWQEGQTITMTLNPQQGDKARIELTGTGTIEKSFEFPLIDLDSQLLDVPDKDHQADITIQSTQFGVLIGQLSIFSDVVTFKCTQEDIHVTAAGDSGTMTARIQDDDIDEYAIEEEIDLSVSYSLPYVRKMCAFTRLNPLLYLHCSAGRPMKMNYPLDGQANGKNYMRFFLAPRVETDD